VLIHVRLKNSAVEVTKEIVLQAVAKEKQQKPIA
jgi:hypothetical protein